MGDHVLKLTVLFAEVSDDFPVLQEVRTSTGRVSVTGCIESDGPITFLNEPLYHPVKLRSATAPSVDEEDWRSLSPFVGFVMGE